MSRTVDERVVSMQFDNKNFEHNARASMSTLDKLKQKLNLSGATKGLNEVHAASKKINFSEMENAAYKSGLHVQDIWLKTASVFEYQVADKIVNAAKRMLSALAIDPVKTGLSEYETQINAVQTIMANVGHKGKTLEDVNSALGELNEYADQTIYNFTEMTKNIGLFTNAGAGLEESVAAIKGFSNAAAMAGTDSTRTAGAMYQLSQAMSTGFVRLQDWKSLEIANITGERFQETLKVTARAHGIAIDDMIAKEGSLRDTLASNWLTADLMTEALNHYTLSTETMTEAEITANKERLISLGYTESQIEQLFKLGTEATAAATKVKTFSQLWGVLQESAQSGWAKTWQIIIGDFEEAKGLLTPLANFFTKIIDTMSDWRNNFLATALQSPFGKIVEKIKEIGKTAEKVIEPVQDLSEIVNKVIHGDFGNGQERRDKLTEMGYDWAKVQNLVNEQLGCTVRHAEQASEATAAAAESTDNLVESTEELNDAMLKEIGLTEEEIEVYRKLQEISNRTDIPIEEINGRMLLIESFKNIGQALVSVFNQLKNAWTDTFSPLRPVQLLNIIDKFHQFSESLRVNHDQSQKLFRTFKGLFAIIDLVATVTGGALRIAFNIVKELLKYFNLDILDVTAALGDAAVRLRNWVDSILDIGAIVEIVGPIIAGIAESIQNFVKSVKESEAFKTFVKNIRNVTSAIKEWFAGMKDAENLPQYIAKGIGTAIGTVLKFFRDMIGKVADFVFGGFKDIPGFMADGFVNGLGDGIKSIIQGVINFGKTIISTICDILGIHSPSRVFYTIAGFAIAGFVLGFRDKIGTVFPALGEFANGVVGFIQNIPFGKIFATAGTAAIVAFTAAMSKAVWSLTHVFSGVGAVLEETAYTVRMFGKSINRVSKGVKNALNAMAFKEFAIAIAILAASVLVLSFIPADRLWNAVGVIAALAGVMAALLLITKLHFDFGKVSLGDKTTVIDFAKLALALLSIASAILIITFAAKMIGDMDPSALKQAGIALGAITAILLAVILAAKGLLIKTKDTTLMRKTGADIAQMGMLLISVAASILVISYAASILGNMSPDSLERAGVAIAGFAGMLALIILLTKGMLVETKTGGGFISELTGDVSSVGKNLLAMAGAILILALAAKIIGGMEWHEMGKAAAGLILFAGIITGLMAATKLLGKANLTALGTTLLGMSASILMLAVAAKIIAGMSEDELTAAGHGLTGLVVFIAGLVAATRLAGGNDLKGVGITLMGMAAAIAAMGLVAVLLSYIEPANLAKGIIAVGLMAALAIGMVAATKKAKDVKGTMMGMAAAIGVMALAIALLSFIKPTDLVAPVLAMAALMGMFTLMMSQANKVKKGMKTLIVMVVAIAVMATALALLSLLNVQNALSNAIAMSILAAAMTLILKPLSEMGDSWKKALKGVGLLAAMVVPLAAFALALSIMSGTQNAIANAIALSVLTAAAVGMLFLLKNLQVDSSMKDKILTLALMIVPLGAFVAALYAMSGVQNAVTNAIVLSAFMAAMVGVMELLKLVTKNATTDIVTGIGLLAAMALPLAAFAFILASMSGVQNAIANATALSLLTAVTAVLLIPLKMIGTSGTQAIIGVGLLLAMALPLAAFAFIIASMSGVQNATTNVQALVVLATTMTLLLIPLTLIGFLGVNAIIGVGLLTAMAVPLIAFVGVLAAMAGVQNATTNAQTLVVLATTMTLLMIPLTLISLLALNALIGVGLLTAMAVPLVAFVGVLALMDGIQNASVNTMLLITLMASLTAMLVVLTVIGPFAILATAAVVILTATIAAVAILLGAIAALKISEGLPEMGANLSEFMNNLGDFIAGAKLVDESVKTGVQNLVDTIKMLTSASIGETVASWFTGGSTLADFGTKIGEFGKYMKQFGTDIANISSEKITAVTNSAKELAKLSESVPDGSKLVTFGSKLTDFGKKLETFSKNAANISAFNISSCASSVSDIVSMAKSIDSSAGKKLTSLGDGLVSFAMDLNMFSSAVVGIKIGMLSASLIGLDSLLTKLNTTGQTSIQFSTGAENIVRAFADTIISKASAMSNAVKTMAGSLANSIRSQYSAFKSAGGYLADGFAAGISANTWKASAKAVAMAQAALAAAKAVLKINSPSKVFMAIGSSVPEGFALGIENAGGMVKSSVVDMADGALDSTKTAIAKIADALNSDIDTQPTIRPVLDLSDIESGASSIGGLFNMTPSVGVMSNVGAISSMMNNRQNGGNDDVISALKDLKSTIGGRTGDTYTINGITYDDGTNVSEAVKALVRAARIERRV